MTLTDKGQELLEAALDYAGRGWQVLPLTPDTEVPFKRTNGLKDATASLPIVEDWWTTLLEPNIGIRTGEGSDIISININPRTGGELSLARMKRIFGLLPDTLTVSAHNGVKYHIFTYPRFAVSSRANGLAPGINVKADGGYIVAPPSTVSGKAYSWANSHGVADAPEWLLGLLHNMMTMAMPYGAQIA